MILDRAIPTPPPDDPAALRLWQTEAPKPSDAPVDRPTRPELVIPDKQFDALAAEGREKGLRVERGEDSVRIYDDGDNLIRVLEKLAPNKYVSMEAGPQGNECSDYRYSYTNNYRSAWQSATYTGDIYSHRWYHNPSGFLEVSSDNMLWYSWAAREYACSGANYCNFWGNDPSKNGALRQSRLASNDYGGLTSETGYFFNPVANCNRWTPEYPTDGFSTFEGHSYAYTCPYGGFTYAYVSGSVQINPGVWVPRITEAEHGHEYRRGPA